VGLLLVELLAVLTVASIVYNLATMDRVKPATALYAGPFVRVDGKLVAYRRWEARGTPIILLGGFIVPSAVWNRAGQQLDRDHSVFALDLPPFGYSERKGPYTLRGWTDLVRGFQRRFGLYRPILVGHSLGAAAAVADAIWHPGDLRGIVLLDGDAISASGPPSWVSDVLAGPWFTTAYRIVTSSDWIFRRGLAGALPNHPPFTRQFVQEWQRPFKAQGTLDALRSMLQYGIRGFRLTQTARSPCPGAGAVGGARHGRLGFRWAEIRSGAARPVRVASRRGSPVDARCTACDHRRHRGVRTTFGETAALSG
jgi:pimeloyl-ACP methyl ester carboxylesterase